MSTSEASNNLSASEIEKVSILTLVSIQNDIRDIHREINSVSSLKNSIEEIKHASGYSVYKGIGISTAIIGFFITFMGFIGYSSITETVSKKMAILDDKIDESSKRIDSGIANNISKMSDNMISLNKFIDSIAQQSVKAISQVSEFDKSLSNFSREFSNLRTQIMELDKKSESLYKIPDDLGQKLVSLQASVVAVETALSNISAGKLPELEASAPSDISELLREMEFFIETGNFSKARERTSQIYGNRENLSTSKMSKLTWALQKLGDHEKAIIVATLGIEKIEKSSNLDESDNKRLSDFYSKRGSSYHELEKNEIAFSDLGKAILLNKNNVEALNNRSFIYYQMGKYDEACDDLKKTYEVRSNKSIASNLALCWGTQALSMDDKTRSNELIEQAISVIDKEYKNSVAENGSAKSAGELAFVMAMLYAAQNRPESSIVWIRRAYDHDPVLKLSVGPISGDLVDKLKKSFTSRSKVSLP